MIMYEKTRNECTILATPHRTGGKINGHTPRCSEQECVDSTQLCMLCYLCPLIAHVPIKIQNHWPRSVSFENAVMTGASCRPFTASNEA